MKKETSNKLFILLLAGITFLFVFGLLSAFNFNDLFAAIIGFLVGFGLYAVFLKRTGTPKKKKEKQLKPVSDKREEFYQSKGLSDEDITFFRDTMNNAKNQILQVETNMSRVGKLKAIAHRNNTLHLIKALFKDIVNEPDRLHEVDQFLYVHLPSLADLTEKYSTINNHQAKSKQTFDVLEKSAKTIDEMCQQITDDYLGFRSADISDLTNEVDLAKHRLNREGSSIENDEI